MVPGWTVWRLTMFARFGANVPADAPDEV